MTSHRRDDLELDYSERAGFLTGKAAAIADWQHRKETREFSKLCRRLSWRKSAAKWWRELSTEERAVVVAYRKAWARLHPEQVRESSIRAKRKRRSNPKIRARENAEKRARRAAARQARRAATIYTCVVCGGQWSPVGRIPSRPPKYCSQSCRARANYRRGKAAGKDWALRGPARKDALLRTRAA